MRWNLCLEGEPRFDDRFDGEPIRNRKRSRIAQTDRANVGVRLAPKEVSAAAEHLRFGLEFDVAFDADDRFVGHAIYLQDRLCNSRRGTHSAESSFDSGASRLRSG